MSSTNQKRANSTSRWPYLTVVTDACALARLGQGAGGERSFQWQCVAVRSVLDGDPLAFRDVRLILGELGIPALDVIPDVCVVREHRDVGVAGALAAAGDTGVQECRWGRCRAEEGMERAGVGCTWPGGASGRARRRVFFSRRYRWPR